MTNILFILEKIGPYHNARFNCISESKQFNLSVLETDVSSNRYPWEEHLNKKYKVFKFSSVVSIYKKLQKKRKVSQILNEVKPDVIYLSGWNENTSHYLLFICQIKKIPIVMLSDSRYKDTKRNIFFELIKKILLKGCSSAIVAGEESENYLIKLGFKKSDIFKPYNVVDNNYFFSTHNSKRFNKYILCVSRFLKRKNHIKLLNSFETYKKKGGKLNLVLIGSGSEKENLLKIKQKLSFKENISIENWKNISELKKYYFNAKVFVLLSKTDNWGLVINEAMASGLPCIVSYECGCYVDLIKDKNTGWGVNPEDEDELANIFHEIDKIGEREFIDKQKNCLNIIRDYSLENFSDAVKNSALISIKKSKFSNLSLLTAYLLFIFK